MTEEENNISPFINILYQVIHKCSLDKEEQNICRWSSNGRSFLVLNGEHFMSLIHDFQKFKQRKQRIKTTNYRSLRRNLNYYRFSKSKIISSFDKKEIVGDAFCHISGYFQRDYPRLSMIKTSCIDKTTSLKEFNPKRTPLVEYTSGNKYLKPRLEKRSHACELTLENNSPESSKHICQSLETNISSNDVSLFLEDIQGTYYKNELGEILKQHDISFWDNFMGVNKDRYLHLNGIECEKHSIELMVSDVVIQ